MRQKRKIVLVVIAVMMVLTLSACGGKGDVKTFVKKMQKVENLDYEIHTYRRYVASQGSDRLFRGESQVRQGRCSLTRRPSANITQKVLLMFRNLRMLMST